MSHVDALALRGLVFGVVVLAGPVGCATIFSGTTAVVDVRSEPVGARVSDSRGTVSETTPARLRLSKSRGYVLVVEKDGYESQRIPLRREASVGWWIVDAFTLGIGNGIDAATGALFHIKPDTVYVVLEPAPDEPTGDARAAPK